MSTFRADMRAAAVTMLTAYASSASLKLQVYAGRPRSIHTPTAFVDNISEAINWDGLRKRVIQVEVVVLHGQFDSADAADQADTFVDGWVDWTSANYHAAGANTILEPRSVTDDPEFVPTWQPEDVQRTYFASVITLEGFAGD